MSETDVILMRALGCADAIRYAPRAAGWGSNQSANRLIGLRLLRSHGVPLRVGGTAGTRKTGELKLKEAADAGLIVITRHGRQKFPYVKLTPKGERRARGLADLPNRADGRAFLVKVAALSQRDGKTLDAVWVDEIALNDGKGWGGPQEDTVKLSEIEMHYLPAASAGWVEQHSTGLGHGRYRVTAAGWKELDKPSPMPKVEPVPEYDDDLRIEYVEARTAKLEEMRLSDPEDVGEIGHVPLPVSHVGVPYVADESQIVPH